LAVLPNRFKYDLRKYWVANTWNSLSNYVVRNATNVFKTDLDKF